MKRQALVLNKLLLTGLLLFSSTITLSSNGLANEPVDAYGDARLHLVEKEIVGLAEESRKDITYQEHGKILEKAASAVTAKVTAPQDLATLAIWAVLNGYPSKVDDGYINYDQVIRQARSTAIANLGKIGNTEAESALWRVVHQTNIDGHDSEELCEAMSQIRKKDFLFGDRVYVHFLD